VPSELPPAQLIQKKPTIDVYLVQGDSIPKEALSKSVHFWNSRDFSLPRSASVLWLSAGTPSFVAFVEAFNSK
jgi:hypothetical protein